MEKLITFAVPCYNSAAYMEHCVDTLLQGGDDIEIILVDDGSTKDDTPAICDRYAEQYPDIVRAIHQPNGGHGEGVNQGLRNARGIYYKVVDSDDWVDVPSLRKALDKLRQFVRDKKAVDMLICNYVYEHVEDNTQRVMHYRNVFPRNRVFGWEQIGRFRPSQYLLMHSVIYRTQLLRDCGLELPKHTFYVDNIFVYQPLPAVKNMYYLDVDFYHYYIGREDQSVNEHIMIQRIDQQIAVNKLMIDAYDLWKISNRHLRHYMLNYLEIITVISTVMLIKSGTEENLAKKRELWTYIKEKDIRLFHYLRNRMMGQTLHLPGKGGRGISLTLYKISQKVIGFN